MYRRRHPLGGTLIREWGLEDCPSPLAMLREAGNPFA
jgi:hypothetical protein